MAWRLLLHLCDVNSESPRFEIPGWNLKYPRQLRDTGFQICNEIKGLESIESDKTVPPVS